MCDRSSRALIPRPRHAFCSVITHDGVAGLFFGTPEAAFSAAAELSAEVHVRYVAAASSQVLSVLPEMYDESGSARRGCIRLNRSWPMTVR